MYNSLSSIFSHITTYDLGLGFHFLKALQQGQYLRCIKENHKSPPSKQKTPALQAITDVTCPAKMICCHIRSCWGKERKPNLP